ncbi:HNH endonuclease [Niallia sp. Krafla_26]|uniref:HNH endonuclease n=1 Tax=Niallia sp. Krafla_26 TaxID=3064703 RepID=UPI003D1659C9
MNKNATLTELETKQCRKCNGVLSIEGFYGPERSYCKACEKEQKKEYHSTFRGKAYVALNDSRKAVRKVEQEHGVKVEDTLTLHEVLWTLSETECAYCGRETPVNERSLDHITPIRYSHKNTFDNVCMACSSCNKSKNDMPVLTYTIQSVAPYEARALFDEISQRALQTFEETIEEHAEYAKRYYEAKALEAWEKVNTDE